MSNTQVPEHHCILGIELVEGLPVAVVDTTYGGHVRNRGVMEGIKTNPSGSISVLYRDSEGKLRAAVKGKVVTDAKAIMGNL